MFGLCYTQKHAHRNQMDYELKIYERTMNTLNAIRSHGLEWAQAHAHAFCFFRFSLLFFYTRNKTRLPCNVDLDRAIAYFAGGLL